MKKVFKTLIATLLLIPILAGVFSAGQVVLADGEDTVKVVLHKLLYKDGDKLPTIQNTGKVMDLGDVVAVDGAEFTAYDVTEYYHSEVKIKKEISLTEQEINTLVANKIIAEKSKAVTAGGLATFNLDKKKTIGEGENAQTVDAVYAFVETKTPSSSTIVEKAAPIILQLPIYAVDIDEEGKAQEIKGGEELSEIHLYPKNLTQTDKKEFDKNNFDVILGDDEKPKYTNVTTGDLLPFKLTLNIPIDIKGRTYSVTDTPTSGLEFVKGSLEAVGLTQGEDYILDVNGATEDNGEEKGHGEGFTLTLISDSSKVQALAGETLTITYNMKLTATIDPDTIQNNTAEVTLDNNLQKKLETTPADPNKPVEIVTGGKQFKKVDAHSHKGLADAKFVVTRGEKDSEENPLEYAKFTKLEGTDIYVFDKWVSEADATTITTPENGEFTVKGLTNGDYHLVETQAPAGYVTLKDPIKFTIEHGKFNGVENIDTVTNTPKGLLPQTGGAGIAAFLAVGTAILVGTFIVFKRSRKEIEA